MGSSGFDVSLCNGVPVKRILMTNPDKLRKLKEVGEQRVEKQR